MMQLFHSLTKHLTHIEILSVGKKGRILKGRKTPKPVYLSMGLSESKNPNEKPCKFQSKPLGEKNYNFYPTDPARISSKSLMV